MQFKSKSLLYLGRPTWMMAESKLFVRGLDFSSCSCCWNGKDLIRIDRGRRVARICRRRRRHCYRGLPIIARERTKGEGEVRRDEVIEGGIGGSDFIGHSKLVNVGHTSQDNTARRPNVEIVRKI